MQDILIVYDSKTGNTEKVAKALAEAAGERCVLAQVDAAPAADDFAVVVAGYWVDKGAPNAKMKKYLENLHGKKVVLFQTLGADPADLPPGCTFAPRCPYATEACSASVPELHSVDGSKTHFVACHAYSRPGFALRRNQK